MVLGIAEGLIPALLIRNGLATWPPVLNLFSVLGVFFILLGLPIQIWVAWAFVRFGRGTPAPFDPPRNSSPRGCSLRAQPDVLRCVVRPHRLGAAHPFHVDARICRLPHHRPALLTVLVEEPQLRKRFGEPYEEYCQKVPRWIPRFNKESLP